MERQTVNALITENMKTILGFSLSRLSDRNEAEYLASDIIYQLLKSAPNIKDSGRFYAYMWRVAENTYVNYLRARKKNGSDELNVEITSGEPSLQDQSVLSEELRLLRRELALLSEQERQATVLYYVENYSCARISAQLGVSVEMVKYYLFRARKTIREGMDMERILGEKSYNPKAFEIDFWGTKAGDDIEYRSFRERKLRGNILLAAYYTPVTLQELSIELGVAAVYLQDELDLLVERQYLIFKKGKYLTNIPIFTPECTSEILKETEILARQAAKRFEESCDEGFGKSFGGRFSNDNLTRWQSAMLCSHFSLIRTDKYIERTYGEMPSSGSYSLINGGGGSGFVWGRSGETAAGKESLGNGIQGIYNGCQSGDGRGTVIAFNFAQNLNCQHFSGNFTDPTVCIAVGCYKYLPDEWQKKTEELGYSVNGNPNFPVYTSEEYERIPSLLENGIKIFEELTRRTCEIAGKVSADHSPEHIRKNAEHIGAIVYQFNSLENIVTALFGSGWLKPVEDSEKPAMCVIKT